MNATTSLTEALDNVPTQPAPWPDASDRYLSAHPEATPRLNAALAKAQGMIAGAEKDMNNPAFMRKDETGKDKPSTYASLASVIAAIRAAFSACEVSYPQTTLCEDGWVTVFTHLRHSSGESMVSPFKVPVVKKDPQGYASATTYARRVGLMAAAGIAPEDDDGNSNSTDTKVASTKTGISDKDRNALILAFADIGIDQTGLAAILGHHPETISDAERISLKAKYSEVKAARKATMVELDPDEVARRQVQAQAEKALSAPAGAGEAFPKSVNFANCVDRIRDAKSEAECVLIESEFAGLRPSPTKSETRDLARRSVDRQRILADAKRPKAPPTEGDVPF